MSTLLFEAVDFVLTSPAQLKPPVNVCFSGFEWPVYFVPHYFREREKAGLFDERGRNVKIRNGLGFGFFEKMLLFRQRDTCLGITEGKGLWLGSVSSVLPLGSLAPQHPGQMTVPRLL